MPLSPVGVKVAEISISRWFVSESGECVDYVSAQGQHGETLGITEALGMLRLAEDQILRDRDGDEEEDSEE